MKSTPGAQTHRRPPHRDAAGRVAAVDLDAERAGPAARRARRREDTELVGPRRGHRDRVRQPFTDIELVGRQAARTDIDDLDTLVGAERLAGVTRGGGVVIALTLAAAIEVLGLE